MFAIVRAVAHPSVLRLTKTWSYVSLATSWRLRKCRYNLKNEVYWAALNKVNAPTVPSVLHYLAILKQVAQDADEEAAMVRLSVMQNILCWKSFRYDLPNSSTIKEYLEREFERTAAFDPEGKLRALSMQRERSL